MNKKFLYMTASLLSVCIAADNDEYEGMPPLEGPLSPPPTFLVKPNAEDDSTAQQREENLSVEEVQSPVPGSSGSGTAALLAPVRTQQALQKFGNHLLSPNITPELAKAFSMQPDHGVVPEIRDAKKTTDALKAAESYCRAGNHPINAVCALFDRIPGTKEFDNVLKLAQWIEPRDVLYRSFLPDALAQKMIELNNITACMKIGEFMYKVLYLRWDFTQKPFFRDSTLPQQIMSLSCWQRGKMSPILLQMLTH